MKNFIKVLSINFFIIFFIIGIFVSAPIIIQKSFDLSQLLNPANENNQELFENIKIDERYKLQNYNDIEWAKQFYIDNRNKKFSYFDFVTYKPNEFKSETINIDVDGFRFTHGSLSNDIHDVWMFGGSTMYGFGVNDDTTIASEFAKITNLKVRNYGVEGWVVRQELNQLIHEYAKLSEDEKLKKRNVIFYDGANDGLAHCRQEMMSDISTDRQIQINEAVSKYGLRKTKSSLEFDYLYNPALEITEKFKSKLGINDNKNYEKDEWFICDSDEDRANQIALSVAKDWLYAQKIVEANGDSFSAVLQPHAAFTKTNLDYLYEIGDFQKLNQERIRNYQVMYPLFRKYALQLGVNFIDLTNVLDGYEKLYIDHAHLVPDGNNLVARAIKDGMGI